MTDREAPDTGDESQLNWPDGRDAVNITEAAVALGLPRSWVRNAVTARQIPHRRIGRHVRFTRKDLEEILRAAKQAVECAPAVAPVQTRRRSA